MEEEIVFDGVCVRKHCHLFCSWDLVAEYLAAYLSWGVLKLLYQPGKVYWPWKLQDYTSAYICNATPYNCSQC